MAISDNIHSTPKLFFVTFIFLCIGGLFLLTAIASPHWLFGFVNGLEVNKGLWEICTILFCKHIVTTGNTLMVVVQALSILALLGAGGCGLAALAFVPLERQRKSLAYLVAVGCLLSSLANMVTVIIFSIAAGEFATSVTLSWSFILACLGSVCLFTASVTGFVVACKHQSYPGQSRLL